ncbi:MAG: inner rane transporter protein [Rhizobium sp.]|nr:inner rane transporter protein [Rhizobium sp.]
MATGFWRLALAMIPLLLFSAVRKTDDPRPPHGISDYAQLMLPGFFLAADLAAWHLSIHVTTVANATLLANLAPVFVALIGWLFLHAAITRAFAIGLAIAIAGIVILKGGVGNLLNGDVLGDALAVTAALFYAGYILTVGRLRGRFDTLRVMLWSTASAAILILPAVFYMQESLLPQTLFGWAMVIGLALVSHVGGQAAITYALAYLPPAFSSLTLLLQPVVAAILGLAVLGEAIGIQQAIGGAIVLAGIMYARYKS